MTVTKTLVKTLSNGVEMPLFGLGTWKSAPNEVENAVKYALESGYRHIDTAAIYGNEAEVGNGIEASGVPRKDIFVTTKLWNTMHKPEDVAEALDTSLNKLKLDYVDLFLMHYPCANDRKTYEEEGKSIPVPIDYLDTWKAMEALVDSGKARAIGISNFCRSETERLLANCRIKPQVHQMELHPYLKQDEFLKFHHDSGIHVTAYSPFGNQNYDTDGEIKILKHPKVLAVAQKHGATSAQVLVAWALHRGCSVVPKSVTNSRIDENKLGVDVELDDEDMSNINNLGVSKRYADFGKYVGYWYYKDLECPGEKP